MIILGLGSNIGERTRYLQSSISRLQEAGIEVMAVSPVYESPALLKDNAPEEWRLPFLNMATMVQTTLKPIDLLKKIKEIENNIGRQDRGIWAPREIDIDILAYGNLCINEDTLKIPHIGLCSRAFAVMPFADIAPDWQYPISPILGEYSGKSAREIATKFFANTDTIKTAHVINF